MSRNTGTATQPAADAKPANTTNGVPEQPTLEALKALADQARAALAAAEKAANDAQAEADAQVRREQLAGVRTAAEGIMAQTDPESGKADLAELFEAAKVIFDTVREMARQAKVSGTGPGRPRSTASGPIVAGSDADLIDNHLASHAGDKFTVSALSKVIEKARGLTRDASGQTGAAVNRLENVGRVTVDRSVKPMTVQHRSTEIPAVLAGVTADEPKGDEPEAGTDAK